MILYLTDNPIIKKDLLHDSVLSYQLLDWRIKPNEDRENEFDIKFKFKSKVIKNQLFNYKKIVAIIAPSNYKLIYDLLYIQKTFFIEVVFYSWDSFKKREVLQIDNVNELFNQYIQRGYLTKLLYKKLSVFNLQRIEQFVLLLSISTINSLMKCGDLVGSLSNKHTTTNNESTIGIIRVLCYSGYTIRKAIDKLIYHSRKLDITDPFIGEFEFLETNNSLYKLFLEHKDTNVYKGIDSNFEKDNGCGITAIFEMNKNIMPITDLLKTLRFLEKNEIIHSINKKCTLELTNEIELSEIKKYSNYISESKWKDLYSSKTFIYNGFFPDISVPEDTFACPLCGSTKYNLTPKRFFCSDNNCQFQVNRIVSPGGVKKTISEKELIRMIKYGDTIIKNKMGGYSRFFMKRIGNRFKIYPQIEKNSIIEE